MPTVIPDTHIARVDGKARFTDLEVTGDFVLGDDATVTGDLAVIGTLAVTSTSTLTGVVTAAGGLKLPTQTITGDGAITIKSGVVLLTKGSAAAITLAAPTSVTDDGKVLFIVSSTAQAHVVTHTEGFGAGTTARDVATFGGAINDGMACVAIAGVWYALYTRNVTIA